MAPSSAAVIGGGPAGLLAAEVLATAGIAVTVYDRMPTVGRKLLMAGRGGLNLTHGEALDTFLSRYREARQTLAPLIEAFPPEALRAWSHGLGQSTFVGSSGRVFPDAMKASPLLRAWLGRLQGLGVTFRMRHRWMGWAPDGALVFAHGEGAVRTERADVTVLALGGASWPRLGSDGGWVDALRAAGARVAQFSPANCGVRIAWSDVLRERFEGAPLKRVALTVGGESQSGEAVVTRDGLEGGAIYALVPHIRQLIVSDGKARLEIDLRPGLSESELVAKLSRPRGKQSMANFLRKTAGLAPVAIGLVREAGPLPADADGLARRIKAVPVEITGLADLTRAISSAGGVTFDCLDQNLMLSARPGVFVAGEMLDWEAPTGGYLLQATFATAVRAAEGAIGWLRAQPLGSCDDDAR